MNLTNYSFSAFNQTVNMVQVREDVFIRQYCAHLSSSIFTVFLLIWVVALLFQIAAWRGWVPTDRYADYAERIIRAYLFLGGIGLAYFYLTL